MGASIEHICTELDLPPIVKQKSIEFLNLVQPETATGGGVVDVSESVANAVACAIVSMAHEELWKIHRVPRHLPDRIVGRIYGLSSATVVYNKHLISSVIMKKKLELQREKPREVRTLR
jgi:hypothetical protein